jgi:hypothetical protein
MGELIKQEKEASEFGKADLEPIFNRNGIDADVPEDGSFAFDNMMEIFRTCANSQGAVQAEAYKRLSIMLKENDPEKLRKAAWEVGALDKSN